MILVSGEQCQVSAGFRQGRCEAAFPRDRLCGGSKGFAWVRRGLAGGKVANATPPLDSIVKGGLTLWPGIGSLERDDGAAGGVGA